MTPQQIEEAKKKAKELANKFVRKSVFEMTNEELKEERKYAKEAAKICYDKIIEELKIILPVDSDAISMKIGGEIINRIAFYEEMKNQIDLM